MAAVPSQTSTERGAADAAASLHAVVRCHVVGSRAGRPPLGNRTIHLCRVEDGLVRDIWFHTWDQAAVDAFWS